MRITLALQSPRQVGEACRTTAQHIRLGYPYCSLAARRIWPIKALRAAVSRIMAAGKRPQLVLPFCPLEKGEEGYWRKNIALLKEFPRVEAVISSWGMVNLPLRNNKIASPHLKALNSQEISLLRECGVRMVALPLSLNEGARIRRLISSSIKTDFEYHLDGEVMANYSWLCQADSGSTPDGNGHSCLAPKTFAATDETMPEMQTRGNTIWLGQQMATLQQVQELASWGIKRGVISWGSHDLRTIEELITLYQVVLAKGPQIVGENEFFQHLRKQIRFHYFN